MYEQMKKMNEMMERSFNALKSEEQWAAELSTVLGTATSLVHKLSDRDSKIKFLEEQVLQLRSKVDVLEETLSKRDDDYK
jgi:peptidoglycan hydrolase CwlO-like protein